MAQPLTNPAFSPFPLKKGEKKKKTKTNLFKLAASLEEIGEQNTRSAAVKSSVHLLSAQKGSRNSMQSRGLARTTQFTLKEESQTC